MNPLQALIIDDEPLAHKVILQYSTDLPFLNIAGQAYQATEAYTLLERHLIDLIFLDIQMPRLLGLDFLRTLQRRPQVIITSAYEEYALEGYELQICDYLLKPFRFDRFLQAVRLAQQRIQPLAAEATSIEPTTVSNANDRQQSLFLKVDKRFRQVALTDMVCLESYGNYVKVWTGEAYLLTPRTLTSFVDELPAEKFIRVHKSFLVQKSRISYIEGHRIFMDSGQEVPVGKSFRNLVKDWF